MPNKDVTNLMRELRRQGATIETKGRAGGKVKVVGPDGFYLLHKSPSAGGTLALTRKHLRSIGFDV